MRDPWHELNRGRRANGVGGIGRGFLSCSVSLCIVSACGADDSRGPTTPEAAADDGSQGNSSAPSAGDSSPESGAEGERPRTMEGPEDEGPDPEGSGPEGSDPEGSGQSAAANGAEPGAEGSPSTMATVLESMLTQYRAWHPRTPAPVNVSSDIFTLCRSPTLSEDAFVESEHGYSRLLMDWLNPAARAGFEELGDEGFAPGAAIVKEKLAYREGSPEPELVAIGIMLKHEPGFDSELGDWEFAYWEEEPGLIDGRDQSAYCGGCHASSATDFVFLDDSWREPTETR